MTDQTQRGQLRFDVASSSAVLQAGTEFSVSVNVTNPFETPITIRSVATRLPVEFVNATDLHMEEQLSELESRIRQLLKERAPQLKLPEVRKRQAFDNLRREIIRSLPVVGSLVATSQAAVDYVRASNVSAVASLDVLGPGVSPDEIKELVRIAQNDDDGEGALRAKTVEILERRAERLRADLQKGVVLQPGNSTVQVFTLRTAKWLLFRPSSYTLHIEVEYEVDGAVQRDVVRHELVMAASMRSLIVGAALGAGVGSFNRSVLASGSILGGQEDVWRAVLLGVSNILLGVVAVVIFARKTDTQPLFTIQDFWGGVLAGFLVGYMGTTFFDSLLPTAQTAAS